MHRARAKKRFGEAFFSKANHFGTPIFNMNVDRTVDQPTFWEFVQYVKENPAGNEHWTPVYHYCDPCTFKYEIIAHFEHLGGEDDEGHLLSMTIAPKNHTLKSQARRNAHKGTLIEEVHEFNEGRGIKGFADLITIREVPYFPNYRYEPNVDGEGGPKILIF